MTEDWEEKAKQEDAVLGACCHRILSAPDNAPLFRMLRKIALGGSYVPGRDASAVAWAEGKRALATFILHKGGMFDG